MQPLVHPHSHARSVYCLVAASARRRASTRALISRSTALPSPQPTVTPNRRPDERDTRPKSACVDPVSAAVGHVRAKKGRTMSEDPCGVCWQRKYEPMARKSRCEAARGARRSELRQRKGGRAQAFVTHWRSSEPSCRACRRPSGTSSRARTEPGRRERATPGPPHHVAGGPPCPRVAG